MSFIKLSFCIPTYNRAKFLNETLNSIINQANDSIEIVISDNASTDNTRAIVDEARHKFPNILYSRWPQNMGADLNYLKTVELANGEFCWFLGSDDTIKKGAVKKILNEIKNHYDIYLCSEYLCDLKLKPYAVHYLLDKRVQDSVYDISIQRELIKYFSLAQSHSALFGYLSVIIFKREKWLSVQYDKSYTGTLYSHMFMLYSFIEIGCKLKYIKEPLVYWRSVNDSFGGPGKIQYRYLIDINGFKKIMDTFFMNNNDVLSAFQGAFRRHHPLKNIAYLRLNTVSKSDWEVIEKKLVKDYGYNKFLLSLMRKNFIKPILYVLFLGNRVYMKARRSFV